jgi:hypothetical protein
MTVCLGDKFYIQGDFIRGFAGVKKKLKEVL